VINRLANDYRALLAAIADTEWQILERKFLEEPARSRRAEISYWDGRSPRTGDLVELDGKPGIVVACGNGIDAWLLVDTQGRGIISLASCRDVRLIARAL
jgi:hypothetical protein